MALQDATHFPSGDVVFLDRGNGTSALVHLYGGTLISWKCQGVEQIFLSSTSVFDNKKAIRGGIPLVFPNFGPWKLGPQHGFARIKRWSAAVPPQKDHSGDVLAVFSLEDDEETRSMWNYKFKLVYTLELKEKSLKCSFAVHNTGTEMFDFTCLLHTYFRVADIGSTSVTGLKGLSYVDKLKGGEEFKEDRDKITVAEGYDRVYKEAPTKVNVVSEGSPSRSLEVSTFNFPDVVVWNPWADKAREMGDFDDLGYKEMLCVEAGKVSSPVQLAGQQHFECSQTLKSLL